jgi:hypothetical protein
MFQEVTADNFSADPRLTDRPRNGFDGKSEEMNPYSSAPNHFSRRNSVDKGKQMMDLKKKTNEINSRLQSLENRIKFIESEQIKAQKSVLLAKEKYKKYSKIRQSAEDDKHINSTVKDMKVKQMLDAKEKIALIKTMQKESILTQKEKILRQNLLIKSEVKKKILKDEAEIQRNKNNLIFQLQRKNRIAAEEVRYLKENNRIRTNSLKTMKEEQYLIRMQSEIEVQTQALERIKSLERLEQLLLENRKYDELSFMIDDDLLSFRRSPLNSSRKINMKMI